MEKTTTATTATTRAADDDDDGGGNNNNNNNNNSADNIITVTTSAQRLRQRQRTPPPEGVEAVNVNNATTTTTTAARNTTTTTTSAVDDDDDDLAVVGCGVAVNESNVNANALMRAETGAVTTITTTITTQPMRGENVEKLLEFKQVSAVNNDVAAGAGAAAGTATAVTSTELNNKQLLLCRRFKDCGGILRNFNSLPLFVYATSSSTHATSADGVGVSREANAVQFNSKNDSYELAALCGGAQNNNIGSGTATIVGAMDCLPPLSNASGVGVHHHHNALVAVGGAPGVPGASTTAAVVGVGGGVGAVGVTGGVGIIPYQHHVNLNHHHHQLLAGHHSPYSNNYPLHHSSSHHHIHSDQTKSLQELQHEVGALLEFRDLVIETFPDLKHKMASMSSSASTAVVGNGGGGSSTTASVSGTNTLTGGMSSSSLASSRREWEPGIRIKRKLSQKEPSTSSTAATAATATTTTGGAVVAVTATTTTAAATVGELSSSSLTRSRSNSHSGKKEPKSGENHNGSVVQDSGFSTETSSSKDGHSASSTNGAITGPIASNRLSCVESDDELLNLLDVIHRKSNRLREEMDQLQNYERQNLRGNKTNNGNNNINNINNSNNNDEAIGNVGGGAAALVKSSSSNLIGDLTPKTFREHVERLNKEDIKQLRKERDRLLDKLAEMEAETLTGRIKAAKMNDQVEELISVKKDLEEQLKLAMAQKLELSSRVQQLQLQQSKSSSSSQSEYSSQRNFLSSASTVLSTGGSGLSHVDGNGLLSTPSTRRPNTFQPVVVEQQQQREQQQDSCHVNAFHQSAGSDNSNNKKLTPQNGGGGGGVGVGGVLGRLDGVVSTPGARNTKCRIADSKRFAAILLETSVIELQRHLLTLTVQNQVLMQKLEQATKSKSHLAKRLDKSKEDVEDLRFQLEEKNIELEGTKAQLRVLESRIHSVTPTTTTATNSNSSYLLHSHNDYETNRSSASTTLMLSRRGTSGIDSHCSEMRSGTPNNMQMPAPTATQISTPSMKAMVHLPMDDMQQHSSSTESAHEHDELLQPQPHTPQSQAAGAGGVSRLMSASVGGVSPFDVTQQQARGQQLLKKFVSGSAASSKPSKIPLPGSKTASYFANKPPTGRSSTAGRSPPSAHTSTGSNASSKSSLSRSTGNLLYSKSPNSLKRADSAQSIRKDNNNSSLSTNTSRSSTSSSIPLSTTPYNGGAASRLNTSPSPRVLQNSPLPKLKRESLTSRMRHMDSLSRMHHNQQQQNHSNTSDFSSGNLSSPPPPPLTLTPATTTITTATTMVTTPYASAVGSHQNNNGNGSSFLVSSTPKPTSAIVTQFNSALRKDLHLSSSSFSQGATQPFTRRSAANANATANVSPSSGSSSSSATRRFSSASVLGARVAARTQQQQQQQLQQQQEQQQQQLSGGNGNGNASSDTDSGKSSTVRNRIDWKCEQRNAKNNLNSAIADESSTVFGDCERQSRDDLLIYDADVWHLKARQPAWWQRETNADMETEAETMYSDKLLVTFDYGYADMNSFEAQLSHDSQNECDQLTWNVYPIKEEVEKEQEEEEEETSTYGSWDYKSNTPLQSLKSLKSTVNQQQFRKNEMAEQEIWFHTPNALSTSAFQVHHVQHVATKEDAMSLLSNCSHMEYDVTDDEDNNDDDVNVPEHVQMNREHWERAYEYDGNAYYDSLGYI